MIKGLIFDADGTLLDSMKIWDEIVSRFLVKRGKVTNPELEEKIASMSIEQGVLYLKSQIGLEESPEQIKSEIFTILDDFYKDEVQLKIGVKEFLLNCKNQNIPMCVASSSSKQILEQTFSRLQILDCFTDIYSCNDFNTSKHEPNIYFECIKGLSCKLDEVVIFEDTLIPVTTAKKAGFFVVGVQDSYSSKDKDEIIRLSDLYIEDFTKFKLEDLI